MKERDETMKWIRHGRNVERKSYSLTYDWNDSPGTGYSFSCDEHGIILEEEMNASKWQTLKECTDGTLAVTFQGMKTHNNSHWEPGIIQCSCGRQVELRDVMTNTCQCG